MVEQKWKRVEYDTWDAAFKGMVPHVRQQSVRVAAYTRELYVQACAMGFGRKVSENQERVHGRYADVAFKCGMYHQLGKALVPPEYQLWQPDFTEEEQQLYRKYTTDGRTLVATLQHRSAKARAPRKQEFTELPTENIPWLMIRESCQQHMERYDGSGYPDGLQGDQISPIAQIVGLARELDALASGTRSEDPFYEAVETLRTQSGALWNPELIRVLDAAVEPCWEVYRKYIHYTMALPKTIPLVERGPNRSMGLSYRRILAGPKGKVVAYEACPWFAGILGQPGEVERYNEIAPMLRSTKLTHDVVTYFLYEAADTILRMQNCKLDVHMLLLQMPDDFYNSTSYLKTFNQFFEDQPIVRSDLMLTVSEQVLRESNKATLEVIGRYMRAGIVMMVDGLHPDQWEPEKLKEYGFKYLRLAPDACVQEDLADTVEAFKTWGFTILADQVETKAMQKQLFDSGVAMLSGPVTGQVLTEDDMIRESIVRQYK